MQSPTGRRAPGTPKARWSTAKKAAAKKTKTAASRGKGPLAGDGPRVKKPRWVDGAPARPAAKDAGKPRRSGATTPRDGYAAYPDSRAPRRSRGDGTAEPTGRTERYAKGGERRERGPGRDGATGATSRPDTTGRPRYADRTGDVGRPAFGGRSGFEGRPGRAGRPGYDSADRPGYDGADRPARRRDDQDRRTDERGRRRDDQDRRADERGRRRDDSGRGWGGRPAESGRRADTPHRESRPVRVERERAHRDPVEWRAPSTAPGPQNVTTSFADLGLPEAMIAALGRSGIRHPFPIQEAAIPDALAGRDVLGRGRTGSGKTLAFGLPTLARLVSRRATPNRPRALVLVPTRELALQVADALEPIARALGVSQKVVAGGMPYPPQLTALDRGLDLVVATPGRLQDLIDRGAAILDDVEIVILDEADHMADLGFLPEVVEIMDLIPAGGQRLLFSATLDKGIDELVTRYLVDPVTHSTDDPTAAVTTMDHTVLLVEPSMKKTMTARISGRPGKTLIFVRTQLGADRVAGQLRESGILAGPLHGGLTQAIRTKVLEAFKDGRLDVLVATDVAARGIHVDDVSQVVQVDPPSDHKTYVHRAGRTARAGSAGSVITLALPHQRKAMERIIDEVALSIRPERVETAGERGTGPQPSGIPVPEETWQAIIAPRMPRGRGQRRPTRESRPRRRF